MPDRLIRESWCASEKIDRLTPFEETVLARLIVNCDDFGRMDGRANVLCSRLFVTRRDVGPEQMRSAIAALEREGLVSRYAVAGREYIQMRGWGEHQRIRTQRSKYPAPPDAAEASRGISLAYHAAEAGTLPGNAGNAQAMLSGGGTARVAEMLPDNAGNVQVALPGGGAGGRTASFDAQPRDGAAEGVRGPFDEQPRAGATVFPDGQPRGGLTMFPGEQVRAGAESHPYYMAGSVPLPPGTLPGQGAQAGMMLEQGAAHVSPMQTADAMQAAGAAMPPSDGAPRQTFALAAGNAGAEAAAHALPSALPGQGAQADFALLQPAADRSNLPQPAADCGNLQQPAADCSNSRQLAADRCNLRLESESNPNPNRNPKENPNRSRESKPIGSPAAPAGAVEGARAREAFSEFWKKYPKKAGRAEALEAYLREKAYLQQKTLLAALAEQCKNENWRKERGRFVPRAANWLADHRWEETPLPPAADEGGTGPPSRREQELLRMVNDPIEALLRAEQEEV